MKKIKSLFTGFTMVTTACLLLLCGLGLNYDNKNVGEVYASALHTCNSIDFDIALNASVLSITESENYVLTDDVTLGSGDTISIGNGADEITVNICLNGFTWDLNSRKLIVNTNASLNIYDCSISGEGTITSDIQGEMIYNAGTLSIYGGKYIDNSDGTYAIIQNYGTINVYDGSFMPKTNATDYIIDSMNSSIVNMNGGEFGTSSLKPNIGIRLFDSSIFNFSDGEIYGSNYSIASYDSSTLNYSGEANCFGEVSVENVLNMSGGVIFNEFGGALSLSGTADISGGEIATGSEFSTTIYIWGETNLTMGKVYLSNNPIISSISYDYPEEDAEETLIYASKDGVAYNGSNLSIRNFDGFSNGDVVVLDVLNQTSASKFTIQENYKKLTYTGTETKTLVVSNIEYAIEYYNMENAVHADGYPTKHIAGTTTTLLNPTKSGYIFNGWYGNLEFTGNTITQLESNKTYASPIKLYAKWTVIPAVAPSVNIAGGGSTTYGVGKELTITTTPIVGQTITQYRWYSTIFNSNMFGTLIDGANTSTYETENANANTTTYYYCVVTATRTDNNQTAETKSDVVGVTITQKQLTISGTTLSEKEYDGDRDADASVGTVVGVVGDDDVIVTISSALYDNANAGENKSVVITYEISGTKSANYLAPVNETITTGVINTKNLVVSRNATDRTYDNTNVVALTYGDISGIVGSDEVSILSPYSGTIVDKNAGDDKLVTAENIVLTGSAKNNYTISATNLTIRVNIEKISLNATISPVVNKGLTVEYGSPIPSMKFTTNDKYIGGDTVESIWGDIIADQSNYSTTYTTTSRPNSGPFEGCFAISLSRGAISALVANYEIISSNSPYITVTKKKLNVTGLSVTDREYDGTTVVTLNGTATLFDSIVGTDDCVLTGIPTASITSANASTFEKNVTISGLSLTGTDNEYYELVLPSLYITISNKKIEKPTKNNTIFIYTATAQTYEPIGFDSNTMNIYNNVQKNANPMSGGLNSYIVRVIPKTNYEWKDNTTSEIIFNFTINKKQLTIGGASLTTKEYDGNRNANYAIISVEGIIGEENVIVSIASALYEDANVGENKNIVITYSLSGTDKANYEAPVVETITTGIINPKQLTISDSVLIEKEYDGNRNANYMIISVGDIVGEDDVIVSIASALYEDANVGENKVVVISYSVSGLNSANYVAPIEENLTTGKINKKQLTIGGAILSEKEYDGNTNGDYMIISIDGIVGEENVIVSTESVLFENANVGENKNVIVSYSISGTDKNNYFAPINETLTTGKINPKQLTISDSVLIEKEYDGTKNANYMVISFAGIIGEDNVIVSVASALYEDANAGEDKNVVVTYSISGIDSSNYSAPVNETLTTGKINKKQLVIGGAVLSEKTYDGNRNADYMLISVEGIVDEEHVLVSVNSALYDNANVGENKNVVITYSISGTDIANYEAPVVQTLTSGKINPKQLTISNVNAINRQFNNTLIVRIDDEGELVGVIDNTSVSLVKTGASGLIDSVDIGLQKAVTISGFLLSGDDADNYTLVQPTNVKVDITPASIEFYTNPTTSTTYVGQTLKDIPIIQGVVSAVNFEETNINGVYSWENVTQVLTSSSTVTILFAPTSSNYRGLEYNFTLISTQLTVTWKNFNNEILRVDNINYGTNPVYNGVTPVKTDNLYNNYILSGWFDGATTYSVTDTIPAPTKSKVYFAVYTYSDPTKYYQTFNLNGGEFADNETSYEKVSNDSYKLSFDIEYHVSNQDVMDINYLVQVPNVKRVGYTLVGWFLFENEKYYGFEKNNNNNIVENTDLNNACFNADSTIKGYTFYDFRNLNIIAKWDLNTYTINLLPGVNGSYATTPTNPTYTISTTTAPELETPTPSANYVFDFWKITNIDSDGNWTNNETYTWATERYGDITLTAQYKQIKIESPETNPANPNVDVVDSEIELTNGVDEDIEFVVVVKDLSEINDKIVAPKNQEIVKTYNAVLITNSGHILLQNEYSGTMKVKIIIPIELQGKENIKVVMFDKGENEVAPVLTEKAVLFEGDYLVFETNTLGDFAIVSDISNNLLWLWIIIGIIIIGLIILLLIWIFSFERKITFILNEKIVGIAKFKRGEFLDLPYNFASFKWFVDKERTKLLTQTRMGWFGFKVYRNSESVSKSKPIENKLKNTEIKSANTENKSKTTIKPNSDKIIKPNKERLKNKLK